MSNVARHELAARSAQAHCRAHADLRRPVLNIIGAPRAQRELYRATGCVERSCHVRIAEKRCSSRAFETLSDQHRRKVEQQTSL